MDLPRAASGALLSARRRDRGRSRRGLESGRLHGRKARRRRSREPHSDSDTGRRGQHSVDLAVHGFRDAKGRDLADRGRVRVSQRHSWPVLRLPMERGERALFRRRRDAAIGRLSARPQRDRAAREGHVPCRGPRVRQRNRAGAGQVLAHRLLPGGGSHDRRLRHVRGVASPAPPVAEQRACGAPLALGTSARLSRPLGQDPARQGAIQRLDALAGPTHRLRSHEFRRSCSCSFSRQRAVSSMPKMQPRLPRSAAPSSPAAASHG